MPRCLALPKQLARPPQISRKELACPNWQNIMAPAGTPRDIINRLNAEWVKVAAMPSVKQKMLAAGFETVSSTPEECDRVIKSEIVRWAKVIKDAKIPPVD